jgi:hypothetical protein
VDTGSFDECEHDTHERTDDKTHENHLYTYPSSSSISTLLVSSTVTSASYAFSFGRQ